MGEHWTEADIPDLTGRVIVVTGANSGIGYEAARAFAQHGATVVLACRNRAKAESAVAEIEAVAADPKLEILDVDLADLDSVSGAAKQFLADHDRLDALVNNAGLMALPHQTTAQGYEMQFGVNHLAPFALTGHLLERLLATEGSRVVAVSSTGHRPGRIDFDDLQGERRYGPWVQYFQSKLANLLFTYELQRRLAARSASTIAVAAHPGGSNTNLGHENPGGPLNSLATLARPVIERVMQPAAMGALPTMRAATDPEVVGGDYYGPDGFMEQRGYAKKVGSTKRSHDLATAQRLWTVSEELTGVHYTALD
jgi:NAD(P)-dependent dehydrogenase (short-subunit alcohol dehydrogenase family)